MRRSVGALWLALVLAACGGGSAVSEDDYAACTELYRLGMMSGDQAGEMQRQAGRIDNGDIRSAAEDYIRSPDPDTSRALVKACGDKVPAKP